MLTRCAAALTLALIATALVGCGSSAETKQDFIARANAICTNTVRNVRSVAPPSTSGGVGLPALAHYLRAVTPLVASEVKQLQALPRPASDRALLRRYLAALAANASHYRVLADAARAGNSQATNAALAALQASPAGALAGRYGLTACARTTGTAPTS